MTAVPVARLADAAGELGWFGNLVGGRRVGSGVSVAAGRGVDWDGERLSQGGPETGGEPGQRMLSAVRATVDEAFEAVYRSDYARLVRAAHMLTGSNETAEEVVQEAFVALYPRFDTVAEPTGYLYRSVVNGCWARRRKRRVVDRLGALRQPNAIESPEIDEAWTALRRLSARRRMALVLRFYADLPLADIAEAMGCSTGTVKSLLHRGLAQLKEVIDR